MVAAVVDVNQEEDPRDIVFRAVEALAAGKVVAIPTETVYGVAASALNPQAVNRLMEAKGRSFDKPLALAVKSSDDALDYVPDMSQLARRLARRCWPGPVTLVLESSHPDSVIFRLPKSVQNLVIPSGKVGLRVPAHSIALQVLRLSAGPLVLTSANRSGQEETRSGQEVAEQIGQNIDLIIEDGVCRFGQSSTVLHVNGREVNILREGVVDEATIKQMSIYQALIVCTGNTCRSPMAELLLKKQLAEKLSCSVDELPTKGIQVSSAGIAAMPGGRPSAQSVDVMAQRGVDLNNHASQPISEHLVRNADLILTMTNGHRTALLNQWPDLLGRTHVVRTDGADVSDPIGHGLEVYQQCADQIDQNLSVWTDRIIELSNQP